ncbi:MAG: helix-turn-helix domain-containing protein [Gammaproteobacteria bacterium]|nr:helix-turn-helix domain-containing protein [Gammaproteobacteria bacterium]
MYSKVPGTARGIIESLIIDFGYSSKQIADALRISKKTIYRIKKGFSPKPVTHLNLIQLYLSLQKNNFEQDQARLPTN